MQLGGPSCRAKGEGGQLEVFRRTWEWGIGEEWPEKRKRLCAKVCITKGQVLDFANEGNNGRTLTSFT